MVLLSNFKNVDNNQTPSEVIEQRNHYCFVGFFIPEGYDEDNAKLTRKQFYDNIINYPDIPHSLSDFLEKREYNYTNRIVRCTPLIETQLVNKSIVINVANQIDKEYPKYRKTLYHAFIYLMLKEGLLGTGYERMPLRAFQKFICEFKRIISQNLNRYITHSKEYPHWRVMDSNNNVNKIKTTAVLEYTKLFIEKYKVLYAETYDKKGITMEKLKELLLL